MRYGAGPEVLRDISFNLPSASFHFLTGPSGAGKSTLLDAIHAFFDSDVYSSIFPVLRNNDSQFWAASMFKDDRQCLVPGVFPFVAAEAPDRHDHYGIHVSFLSPFFS